MYNNRILAIDDTHLNLKIMKDILEGEGFEFFSSCTVEGIEDLVEEVTPDVILLDIVMPIRDGFDICKSIKSNSRICDIPIIMVSASTKSTELKKALDLGAFDYIKKPFEELEVIARVNSALRLKMYQTKLKDLATKDGLTGIYNRSTFMELLSSELNKKEDVKSDLGLALLMIDIDDFKHVNDTYGHQTGDLILKELSAILKSSIKRTDFIGRYGGEEICIVLNKISREDSISVAERLRSITEKYDFMYEGNLVKITISIGVVFKRNNVCLNCRNLVKTADSNLYQSKHNGKNQYTAS